jgi:hypothetical protein
MLLVCQAPPKGRGAYVWHQIERADGPALRPDSSRSGQSAPVGVSRPGGPRADE